MRLLKVAPSRSLRRLCVDVGPAKAATATAAACMQAIFTLALLLNAWACGTSAATINPVSPPLASRPGENGEPARRLERMTLVDDHRLRRSASDRQLPPAH